jgi:NAD(P)-dependent dehydrogenase (short-subunit alcohol dehydrogenase family)
MSGSLDGKVGLITGAGSGIGRAAALIFAREGARTALSDVDVAAGEESARMVKAAGGEAVFVKADVSRAAEVEAMVARTVEAYGRLDCAFNNAGIEGERAKTAQCTEENWARVIAINLTGVWLCLKYEIAQMLKQGSGGAIVNAGSIASLIGGASMPAYSASKGGVLQLTRSAALEYARKGIRVNCTCPGGVRTPMLDRLFGAERVAGSDLGTPIGRLGSPEEIAQAVAWLCSDAASFVTGVAFPIDGGVTAS